MGSRILVADDEPHIRGVVRAYLEREGYEVVEAEDGEAALEHGRQAGLDLLVLDVMLPGLSGFDVLRALRSEGSSVGVLMLTARDDVIDRVAGLELGADDYVTKPFEPREVVARVGAILRRFGRPASVQRVLRRTDCGRPLRTST
jgi:two-component system OmpR family response regulator